LIGEGEPSGEGYELAYDFSNDEEECESEEECEDD